MIWLISRILLFGLAQRVDRKPKAAPTSLGNTFLVLRFCGKTKMKAAGRHGIIVNFYINPSVFTGDLRFLPEISI